MKCCGKDVMTPFCPMCGASQRSPGPTLLEHIYKHARKSRTDLETAQRQIGTRSESPAQLRNREGVVEKWEAWACFVGEAIRDGGGAER